jgi:hypothetical protein
MLIYEINMLRCIFCGLWRGLSKDMFIWLLQKYWFF